MLNTLLRSLDIIFQIQGDAFIVVSLQNIEALLMV